MKLEPILFRVSKNDASDVYALMPCIPADNHGRYCLSYQHIGQHCEADYHGCIAKSRPATLKERQPLARELLQIGYRFKIYARAPKNSIDIRLKNASL